MQTNHLATVETEQATHVYYRSRLFTAQGGVNPLVAIAQPLLSFLKRIHESDGYDDPQQLLDNLTHEMKTFESRAQSYRYSPEEVQLAHYLLVTTIHQNMLNLIAQNDVLDQFFKAKYPDVDNQTLFKNFLNCLLEKPEQYIELLELAYMCLNLKTIPLEFAILEPLYQTIRKVRQDKKSLLFVTPNIKTALKQKFLFSWWKILGVGSSVIVLFYAGLSYFLSLNIHVLTQTIIDLKKI